MALEYFDATVYNIIEESPSVRRFQLEFKDLDIFDFIAGQYVKVHMPIEADKTYRQYSIASEPIENNKIELLIVYNPIGLGTNYLFNKVGIGSVLKLSKALGRFVLPETTDKDICLICTGVGLAPFRSMYLDVLNKNKNIKQINLIFGTRTEEDLLYKNELFELSEKFSNFNYFPTLSRSSDSWNGRKGYVHNIYKELYHNGKPALFYLCGWDLMISEAKLNLKEFGYQRRDILFEKYD